MTCRWIEDQTPGTLSGPPSHVRWLGAPGGMLGAAPYPVCKWFGGDPACTQWDQQPQDAKDAILKQANLLESQFNAQVATYKKEGGCDATIPDRLAGALKEYLVANGGDATKLSPMTEAFGPQDCAEWMKVFKKSPTIDDAKSAKTATTWNGKTISVSTICGGNVKLPICQVTDGAGGEAPPAPPCGPANPCPPDQDCFKGDCLPKCGSGQKRDLATGDCVTATPPKKSGLAIFGVFLLASAAIGLVYYNVRGTAGLSPVM